MYQSNIFCRILLNHKSNKNKNLINLKKYRKKWIIIPLFLNFQKFFIHIKLINFLLSTFTFDLVKYSWSKEKGKSLLYFIILLISIPFILLSFINNINISINEQNITNINGIINDNYFRNLINEIMISPVMKDAYFRISNWYLTNGKFDINGNMQITNEQENLINGLPLFYYYKKFCESSNTDKYSNLFIVMGLPEFIKGFTFRFLKVVLNSEGIKFSFENNNFRNTLLKAYLIFVIIHEQNHYIKRFLNVNTDIQLCKTPKIGEDDEGEGGKLLIKLLFGDELIKKSLNVKQAEYILDIQNWKKKNVIDFRKDFLSIKTKEGQETSIIYLSSGKNSICDHTKLES